MSVYGDETVKKETITGLKNAAPYLRSMLAKNLNMRLTPQLFFTIDDSLEYGMKMDALISSLHKDETAEEDSEDEEQ